MSFCFWARQCLHCKTLSRLFCTHYRVKQSLQGSATGTTVDQFSKKIPKKIILLWRQPKNFYHHFIEHPEVKQKYLAWFYISTGRTKSVKLIALCSIRAQKGLHGNQSSIIRTYHFSRIHDIFRINSSFNRSHDVDTDRTQFRFQIFPFSKANPVLPSTGAAVFKCSPAKVCRKIATVGQDSTEVDNNQLQLHS